jgi:hypothetical protein
MMDLVYCLAQEQSDHLCQASQINNGGQQLVNHHTVSRLWAPNPSMSLFEFVSESLDIALNVFDTSGNHGKSVGSWLRSPPFNS